MLSRFDTDRQTDRRTELLSRVCTAVTSLRLTRPWIYPVSLTREKSKTTAAIEQI